MSTVNTHNCSGNPYLRCIAQCTCIFWAGIVFLFLKFHRMLSLSIVLNSKMRQLYWHSFLFVVFYLMAFRYLRQCFFFGNKHINRNNERCNPFNLICKSSKRDESFLPNFKINHFICIKVITCSDTKKCRQVNVSHGLADKLFFSHKISYRKRWNYFCIPFFPSSLCDDNICKFSRDFARFQSLIDSSKQI